MNVLIAAHYNLNNGDRALLEATIGIIKDLYPECDITVSAYSPNQLIDNRFKTVGWALKSGNAEKILLKLSSYKVFRSFFKKAYRFVCSHEYLEAVRNADVVFVSGGHHLTDLLSKKIYCKLSSNFVVPIWEKKRVVLLPQSIGPASDESVKESISYILENAYSVAYRDESSKIFIESIHAKCRMQYVPDLVYSINPNTIDSRHMDTVGIALYHSYSGEKREKILPFTNSNLFRIIVELIKRNYNVKVIPMDIGDDVIVESMKNDLPSEYKDHLYLGQSNDSILKLINEFSTVGFTLAYKTHSIVFSMICNTPLIAIAYHPKSVEFMKKVGLEEYSINDVDASFENIMMLIDKLCDNYEIIKIKESQGVNNNRNIIREYINEALK